MRARQISLHRLAILFIMPLMLALAIGGAPVFPTTASAAVEDQTAQELDSPKNNGSDSVESDDGAVDPPGAEDTSEVEDQVFEVAGTEPEPSSDATPADPSAEPTESKATLASATTEVLETPTVDGSFPSGITRLSGANRYDTSSFFPAGILDNAGWVIAACIAWIVRL